MSERDHARDLEPAGKMRTRLRRGDAPAENAVPLADGLESLARRRLVPGVTDLDPAALEIGQIIRRLRKNRGLTQTELAELSGVNQGALSAIERGQGRDGPSYRILRDIARALSVNLPLLLDAQVSDAMPGRVPQEKQEGPDARTILEGWLEGGGDSTAVVIDDDGDAVPV